MKKRSGIWTTDIADSLNLLLDTHFPGNSLVEEEQGGPYIPQTSAVVTDIVTESRVKWAINTFKRYKSPGPDLIAPVDLQSVVDNLMPWLLKLYSACIIFGYIPKSWRMTKVVFIPKAGRVSHTTPKDYRPKSLSSFLLKCT